jgi:hypothetical protein
LLEASVTEELHRDIASLGIAQVGHALFLFESALKEPVQQQPARRNRQLKPPIIMSHLIRIIPRYFHYPD